MARLYFIGIGTCLCVLLPTFVLCNGVYERRLPKFACALIFVGRGSVCLFVAKLSMSADIIYLFYLYTADDTLHLIAPNIMHIELRVASRIIPHTYHIRHTFYTNQIDRINTLVSLYQFLFFLHLFFFVRHIYFVCFFFCVRLGSALLGYAMFG